MSDFPVDESTLNNIKHALGARLDDIGDGNPVVVGADFTLSRLLEFYSGYDPATNVPLGMVDTPMGYMEAEEVQGEMYTVNDVISALISEIERLRSIMILEST